MFAAVCGSFKGFSSFYCMYIYNHQLEIQLNENLSTKYIAIPLAHFKSGCVTEQMTNLTMGPGDVF